MHKERRRFNNRERIALYLAQDGKCAECGDELEKSWHADHVKAWSHGGPTDVVNGQAMCPTCNLRKGNKGEDMTKDFREWQRRANDKYRKDWFEGKRLWLCSVTPGGGKTFWALSIAKWLLDEHLIDRVVIIVPRKHILDQWVDHNKDGESPIIQLTKEKNSNGAVEDPRDFQGCVITYQQLASIGGPLCQRAATRGKRTLVISDEVHHAGTPQSWGDALKEAFDGSCVAHIGLTGTPWRAPKTGYIPFVEYDSEGVVCTDFEYTYKEAVNDNVCRKIQFHAFDGEVRYVDVDSCTPSIVTERLSTEDEDHSELLRHILDPRQSWIPSMLKAADDALLGIQSGSDGDEAVPDAKGLVIALNQEYARAIQQQLQRITKEKVALIISDEGNAKEELDRFRNGKSGRWAVSVDMFSEGVDVPSLFVGVYATNKKSPLRWRQSVGRFSRKRHAEERDALIFIPATSSFLGLASAMNEEIRILAEEIRKADEDEDDDSGGIDGPCGGTDDPRWLHAETGEAEIHSIIDGDETYSPIEYRSAAAVCERHQIPSRYAAQVAAMLREELRNHTPVQPEEGPSENGHVQKSESLNKHQHKKMLKEEVNGLVKQIAYIRCSRRGDISTVNLEIQAISTDLIKKYTRRDKMSIEQLQEALIYLRHLKTKTPEDE